MNVTITPPQSLLSSTTSSASTRLHAHLAFGFRLVEGNAAVVGELQQAMRRLGGGVDDAGMDVLRGVIKGFAVDRDGRWRRWRW